jgi:hypothetical protein
MLGQLRFPELLLILKIPSIKIEGEKNYYFMLRSFVNFILNVLEVLKVPAMLLFCFFLVDNFLIRNYLIIIFLISASFPWHNRFKFQDPALYSILIGIFLNIFTMITIPLLWGLFSLFLESKEKVNMGLISIIFIFSLYTVYFPVALIALIIELVVFTKKQKEAD